MIDEMGMKGVRRGTALVSPVHANFIVTEGENARAEDALALAEEIRERVKREQGIELGYEVELGARMNRSRLSRVTAHQPVPLMRMRRVDVREQVIPGCWKSQRS